MAEKKKQTPTLSEYLDLSHDEESTQHAAELFGDDAFANRWLRDLGALTERMKANTDMANHERSKIDSWEAMVNEPLQNEAADLISRLKQYAVDQRVDKDRKTIKLPFGTLATRPEQPSWTIDPDVFLSWAQEGHEELVRVTMAPALAEIKKNVTIDTEGNALITETGELVPGVTATTGTSFSATVKTN